MKDIDIKQFLLDMNCNTTLHRTKIYIHGLTDSHLILNIPAMGEKKFNYPIYKINNFRLIDKLISLQDKFSFPFYIYAKVNTGLDTGKISDLIITNIENEINKVTHEV
jgi:hypothetical protein